MLGGWAYPSEKYEFVSWDDDIPNIWKNKIHVPKHQRVTVRYWTWPIEIVALLTLMVIFHSLLHVYQGILQIPAFSHVFRDFSNVFHVFPMFFPLEILVSLWSQMVPGSCRSSGHQDSKSGRATCGRRNWNAFVENADNNWVHCGIHVVWWDMMCIYIYIYIYIYVYIYIYII